MTSNKVVRVTSRADGIPSAANFAVADEVLPRCPEGGCLVEVIFAAVDPGMRGWLSRERNYMTVGDGEIMRANGVGRVVESRSAQYSAGDLVYGWLGWQQFAAASADDLLWKIDLADAPAEYWLSALGLNGLTAWVGIRHLGRVQAGDTVMVTTCAGGVGSIAGQLAKASGARVVGITGGDDKVSIATSEFGYDAALNYKGEGSLAEAVGRACPQGIDLFFDNTAGSIADAVFPALNTRARIIQCGTAAVSSWNPVPQGPRRERDVLTRRLSWQGFIVFDHFRVFDQAFAEIKGLIAGGDLHVRHEILEGLEHALGAIGHLYSGKNAGRLIIRP
ncbi:NADP-dependent oxidoreductase [Novosphingobium album (ex Hu et al. 2023)]|uniref:NADP-dependent oxidoreductase n=1 Tax=Novosphingobium album (ex Hu et al. 2023) TaxID=2930093 RepID=A0ABT0B6Y2_9SPHN|nr:NADP-dependent oxidoreductase [Novosphingobium album (ex Hu et al. 2023)]MCJ2180758.1 NADP-dependent oxidoreductase [Novosphingobium album (ex Hu et al. 2023)]